MKLYADFWGILFFKAPTRMVLGLRCTARRLESRVQGFSLGWCRFIFPSLVSSLGDDFGASAALTQFDDALVNAFIAEL